MDRIIIWAAILVTSVIVECCTTALVSIWFAPAALACIVLDLVGVHNIYIQLAAFIIITALLVFFMRKRIKESFKSGKTRTNVDSLIGKKAVVEQEIVDGGVGRVVVGGMSWAAFTEEGRNIPVGEKVKIVEISGVKLYCMPVSE